MSTTRQHILARLSSSLEPVSGHVLAQELNVSRAAVWKHIATLRQQGADIQAHIGRGYQLTSEFFNAATLSSKIAEKYPDIRCIGKNILHFDSLDSTNREAMRQAESGCNEGLAIFSDQQTEGRGRLGRTWHTINDALAFSVVLRPPLSPEKVPQLSLLTAVALEQALSSHYNDIRIKWPNDLLIHGAKVAGILTEMRAEPGMVHAVVVGIGVNLKMPDQGWPRDIAQAVTALEQHRSQSHHSNPISRLTCAATILESLDHWYHIYLEQGFTPIREAWWQAHVASGQKVRVYDGKAYTEGIAQALDVDGALLLATEHGTQRIIAGELELLEVKAA